MSSALRAVVLLCASLALAPPRAAADPPLRVASRAGGDVDASPRGVPLATRLEEIRVRVQAAASYPALAQLRRVEGTSIVGFEIAPDGAPRAIEVAASSGSPILDRAAARAVADAGRLPWVYGRLEIPVRFELAAQR
jgi:TonB family protein